MGNEKLMMILFLNMYKINIIKNMVKEVKSVRVSVLEMVLLMV